MVKLLSRPLMAVLSAILLAFLIAAAYAVSFEKDPSVVVSTCPEPPADVAAELDVQVKRTGAVEPQAIVSMFVNLPNDNQTAWDLLRRDRENENHKLALRCVLGTEEQGWYGQPPSVTKEGDRIVLKSETQGYVSLLTDGVVSVGPLLIRTIGPRQWRATITAPAFLAFAHWRQVSVTAPAGWLSGSQPYLKLPAEAQLIRWEHPMSDIQKGTVDRLRWERPALEPPADQILWEKPIPEAPRDSAMAAFVIHPDMRAQIASTSLTTPWRWGPNVLYGLSALILIGALLLWAHRDKATLVRRMCLPIFAVALFFTTYRIFWTYDDWNDGFVYALAVPLLIACMAVVWGVPKWVSAVIGLEAVIVTAYSVATSQWPDRMEKWLRFDVSDWRVDVAAWTALAVQLTAIFAAGIINAARVLLSKREPEVRPPTWVWWCSAAIAVVLVAQHFVSTQRTYVNPWADSQTLHPAVAANEMTWYPAAILNFVEPLLAILAVLGVWALIRRRVETRLDIPDRYVVLMFLIGPVTWYVTPFGLWLPVWLLALLVLWLWLRNKETLLDTVLSQGSTVRSVIENHDAVQLRSAAAQWGRIRNRGRALDRELSKGNISLEAHSRETRKLLEIQPLPNESAETVSQLRAKSVTPVDMMLAQGPGETPLDNAKCGVKIAALVGMPAAALNLWLWWDARRQSSSPSDWVIFDWFAAIAWQASLWLSAGTVLGLLLRRLRFKRGIGKALPLITAYASVELVVYSVEQVDSGETVLYNIALFTVVIMLTALIMDVVALRPANTWWSRRRDALAPAYGMENVTTQVAFFAAQAAAILTIITTIQTGIVEQPSDQVPTPPAKGQTR